jgi:hypothetical protein
MRWSGATDAGGPQVGDRIVEGVVRAGADGHERLTEQRELDDDGAGGARPASRGEEPQHQIDLTTGGTATGS